MSKCRKAARKAPVWASQNFITSPDTIRRMLNRTNLCSSDHVVEIGPGKGHITKALTGRCGLVTAVEIDEKLIAGLRERFAGSGNLHLVHRDFLDWRLPGGSYKVFSNIPFSGTTDIIRKLTETGNPPLDAWLVVEKGAAKRFLGKPSESLRSLTLRPFFECGIDYYLNREDFHPKPSVDAVLLHIKRKKQPDLPPAQLGLFSRFVSAGLGGESGLRCFFTKTQLCRALRSAGLERGSVPGEVRYIQWLCLFRSYAAVSGRGQLVKQVSAVLR